MNKNSTPPQHMGASEWTAIWFFFGITMFLWLFEDVVATALLYIPKHTVQDQLLYDHAQILILMLLTALIGLFAYAVVVRLALAKKPPTHTITRETMSDLMLSREQFRKLYDNSPVPYFLMDDAGNIRNPNQAALRFLEGTREDCVVTNFYSLLSAEEDTKQAMALLRTKVKRSVPISQEETTVNTLQKEEKYALMSIYSLERSSPIPFKHLVTLVDVTKEKESERVKTDFLLLASHQLRTPLTTVKWYIDYLLTTKTLSVSDEVRDYLEQIYVGNERMINLITTLLTVSRIEMGTLAPEYAPVHVEEVVDDILEELAQDVKKKNMEIKIDTEGSDLITTDHTMLRIIIHNLLTNAIKYTAMEGTVTIHSVFKSHDCAISVVDTGHGIPLDEQEKIFTKMFRASNARKVSASGTGLGLYLSKAFVEKLGGTMSFESVLEEGTTFTISLPRIAPDA